MYLKCIRLRNYFTEQCTRLVHVYVHTRKLSLRAAVVQIGQ